MILHNRKHLKPVRKELRSSGTAAEAMMWSVLRKSQLGHKFRRQHSIGEFVVDFYCPSVKLVLEVDGGVHEETGQKLVDYERDAKLKEKGFEVLRITNEEVFEQMEMVIEKIKEYL
jgi:very-short-patch-repair endonuclease